MNSKLSLQINHVRESEVEKKMSRFGSTKTRIYFFVDTDGPATDLFSGTRFNKPHKSYRSMLPEVFKQLGYGTEAIKQMILSCSWSQKAGCSCGCSPGFVMKNREHTSGTDIFVDIVADIVATKNTHCKES